MIERNLELFADYFQFYVQDEPSEGIDPNESKWDELALSQRILLQKDVFAVTTVRDMTVPVQVVVVNQEPELDLDQWDHVIAFSFQISSGRIVVAGNSDYLPEAERITVEPGHYKVRALFANLDAISEDGLEGDDYYRIEMWTGDPAPLQVLKQYIEP